MTKVNWIGRFKDISSDKSIIVEESLQSFHPSYYDTKLQRCLNIWVLVYSKSLTKRQYFQPFPSLYSGCSQLHLGIESAAQDESLVIWKMVRVVPVFFFLMYPNTKKKFILAKKKRADVQ